MTLALVTPPALEPLTIKEISDQLRLDATNAEAAPGALAAALAAPATPGGVTAGAHRYGVTFVTADGETDLGTLSAPVTVVNAGVNGVVTLSGIPIGGSLVIARKLYRTAANGALCFALATLADNTTTTYADTLPDGALGAGAPTSNTTGDPYLLSLIQTARDYAETFTRKRFVSQTWSLGLDRFPPGYVDAFRAPMAEMAGGPVPMVGVPLTENWIRLHGIELPNPPLQSVSSIAYLDTTGTPRTLDPSAYRVSTGEERGLIVPAYGTSWPATLQVPNAVTITFVCGFGAPGAVPPKCKHAMKMLVAHWYSQRELFVTKRFALEVPMAVDALLWAERALEAA